MKDITCNAPAGIHDKQEPSSYFLRDETSMKASNVLTFSSERLEMAIQYYIFACTRATNSGIFHQIHTKFFNYSKFRINKAYKRKLEIRLGKLDKLDTLENKFYNLVLILSLAESSGGKKVVNDFRAIFLKKLKTDGFYDYTEKQENLPKNYLRKIGLNVSNDSHIKYLIMLIIGSGDFYFILGLGGVLEKILLDQEFYDFFNTNVQMYISGEYSLRK